MPRPKLRVAKFADIPAIYEIIAEAHARSRYKDITGIDERGTKGLIMQSIQRHGGDTVGSTFVAVADTGERVEGFIIGVLQPLYLIGDTIEATDLFWLCRPGAHALTAKRLLAAMHKWVPPSAIIRHGNTDAITSAEASGRILRQVGLRQTGQVYEMQKEATRCQAS